MGKQIQQFLEEETHEEMFNTLSHKGNKNQNYTKILPHSSQNGYH
jgi:uncharacterized damage-inducible protein DinB